MSDSAANARREVLRLMQSRDWQAALRAIDKSLESQAAEPQLLMHRAHCLFALGLRREASEATDAVERLAGTDAAMWDAIGTLRSYANDQRRALAACDRAVALAPRNPQLIFNRAAVRRFIGDLEGAEGDYDQVIALAPRDYEAYMNRSELRVQTAVRNHVAELEALTVRNFADWRGEVQVRFALAKEYEDLGEYTKSFEHLRKGAGKRRENLQYDVARDVATVDWIINAFPGVPAGDAPGAGEDASGSLEGASDPIEDASGSLEDAPIFIVGLPRSGSTLVERILGSHSSVSSAGELDCFALSIVDAVKQRSGQGPITRQDLVALSATLDFAELGRDYLRRARAATGAGGRFIDKMPLNYLYCGLIRRALPDAKIVYVARHPMAVGYAMYKTLFKDGYPFSYDLNEIGRYYVAHRRLMQHWRTSMPGAIHELNYEDLVADQRGATRKLLEYCGLDWEEGCMAFHQNPTATTTASAAQVRRPVYSSSVSLWRHYERQLADLKDQITSAGLGV
jgi:tetratricopeptide (TPR) repeat protein